ncbi:deoxyribose-phosphate aldolase [Enterobacillus tribolii]|uniref:Deoxyribose-phosphate aldolase n=1 Tax=Enterobacillus tribolii TaxID=1487935 RepID=A0A370R3S2_9GAMM|nr:deoxyribose-phosphate aldolase [Enterobacillus tribolii]RDK96705.1 deoxyribose-phosphate aldolase [Enterobacillus tribolii]
MMKPNKKAAEMTPAELGQYIDQSVLKPGFTLQEVRKYIQEGIDYQCKTVCINPAYLDVAREMCKETGTGICVVCDFPFGTSSTASKVAQAEIICSQGDVDDLDIVANYGFIRSGLWDAFEQDIRAVVNVAHRYGSLVKVIFETDALTTEQVAQATEYACRAGVDFVKTSTGFFTGAESKGATPEIIAVMMTAAQGRCKVKGSGCIRTREHFLQLIDMGIDRMGIGYRSTAEVLGLSPQSRVADS